MLSLVPEKLRRTWPWWALLLIVLLTAGERARLLDVPLERDEGEYAYGAQLILDGELPYEHLYSMKLPGIYLAYAAALAVFGQSAAAVRLGLLLANATTILLVFLLGRRWFGPAGGVVAAGTFAVLSLGRGVHGLFANAEHFVILVAVGGLLLLLAALDRGSRSLFFASGLLLGLAPLMKQAGLAFSACGLLFLLVHEVRRRPLEVRAALIRCGILGAAMAVPLALTCLVFYASGAFGELWYWTVEVARSYTSKLSGEAAVAALRTRTVRAVEPALPIWLLAAGGFLVAAWQVRARRHAPFLLLLALCSLLAVLPGFYFRPHYFLYLLPAAGLSAGAAITAAGRIPALHRRPGIRSGALVFVVMTCLAWPLYVQRGYLFQSNPEEVSRATFGRNPFVESVVIADHIRQHTSERDSIAVIGSEPQIYFYARRSAATGYVYVYPLMDRRPFALRMQEEMIGEIERARPAFLVYVNIPSSWLQRPESATLIFDWFERYSRLHYRLVGLVEITREGTQYRWAPDSLWPPRARRWVAVLERAAD